VAGAWVIMHLVLSLIFVLTLITSHLTLVTDFPLPDANGTLPKPYYWHQLATSADFYPTSRLANFFWGGFNSHAAHHLFPNYPHTLYPRLSVAVQQTARDEGYPYHEMNFFEAIRSHFQFLKKMGNGSAVEPASLNFDRT
jgi:linoleoyl-CoA desaturase